MIEQVIKRDGKTSEFFQTSKIRNAIKNAYESVGKEFNDDVFQCVLSKLDEHDDKMHVEEIQDCIEDCLFLNDKDVYDSFHDYRLTHKMHRDEKNALVKDYSKKMLGQNIENQNANVDERSHSGRKAEASDIYEKEFALNNMVSKQTKRNHINNENYIHDLSAYASGEHNCLSLPIDDLLANGAVIGQTDVRPAGGIGTAMQLVAVYFQIQSQEQFGGVSATHLDWTMVPYVRKSFLKHYIKSYLKDTPEYLTLDIVKMRLNNYYDDAGVERNEWEDWVEEHKSEFFEKTGLVVEDFCYDNKKKLDPKHFQSALDDTLTELYQAVEGMYHNLNTLQSRSGGQLPFTSINYGTCTLEEGRWVTEALLTGSIKGIGKHHLTPIFPCGIFQCMKGVNRKPGDPNYDLFRMALYSTSKRIYPNYANVDWSNNKGYDKNDPRTYFSTMGCHIKGTKIIMADGTKKNVEDIIVGDKLMGVNGDVRTVQELIRGNGKMYRVSQSRGEDYIVNDGHILSLKYSISKPYGNWKKNDIVNITINDYLALPKHISKHLKGYKASYDLPEKEFDIPPYILGLWLGDGNRTNTRFSVNINESKIIDDLSKYASSIGKSLTIREEDNEKCLSIDVCDANSWGKPNLLRRGLNKYNLLGNKHIPEEYFYGSKSQRSALLAGLINTDGWARRERGRQTICFGNTNLDLINGAKRLAESLGYTTNVILARDASVGNGICEGSQLKPYYHLSIHRFDDEHLMDNKRTNINLDSKRNFSTSTLNITPLDNDDFYGFELDGDHLYMINDNTVTHNCRTANLFDINGLGQMKDGRGNICPTTIILPTLAMEALDDEDIANLRKGIISGDREKKIDKFMRILSRKIEQAKDSLIDRFEWIASQGPESAPFMWKNNTMYGYVPEEGIRSALKHGTLAIGQLGLAECLQILIGCNHTTDEGMELAKRIERLYRKKCADYKEEYKLNFGVYFTPAENLCFTAMKKFKAKYGEIPNISDRDYFTNSMHVPVWEKLTPYEKIDIESQLTGFSSAGCITYVEIDENIINNIDAMEDLVNYAMDSDIPYFALNRKISQCKACGYSLPFEGDICPCCGSYDVEHLGRVTGYLTTNVKRFNYGKLKEFGDRVLHSGQIYLF